MNRINLKGLITVTNIIDNSDGIDNIRCFKLIYSNMIIEVQQCIPLREDGTFSRIEALREKAIASLKWWRLLFPTSLRTEGLFINCYIPQPRKNGY